MSTPIQSGEKFFEVDKLIVKNELQSLYRIKSSEELWNVASFRLNNIIKFCISTVPYYRSKFFKIVSTAKKFDINEIELLPFLTKEIVRTRFIDLCSDIIAKIRLFYRTTSGTTGTPIKIVFDPVCVNYKWVLLTKRLENLGLKFETMN